MSISSGQSVPKMRPRGVVDGKRFNIPVPTASRYEFEEGRRSKVTVGWWTPMGKGRRCPVGQIRRVSREPMPKGPLGPAKGGRRTLPRKSSRTRTAVDRTASDTGGVGEASSLRGPAGRERNSAKLPRNFGISVPVVGDPAKGSPSRP